MTSTHIEKSYPRIAIVGRPNVGKSTLFNRLLGKRRAITDPTPGVTRDPVESICKIFDRPVVLVDTGGFKLSGDDLDEAVTRKSLSTLEKADLIILVMDVTETTPEDEGFLEYLRRYSEKLILAVNKVDNPEREQAVWNFHSYGIGHVIGVSAAHGYNIDALNALVVSRIDFDAPREVSEHRDYDISIAVLGKPNTGKSTLINLLTGTDISIVSDVPGTTRDVIEGSFTYHDTVFKVLDTAGIRRKSRVGENVEYYSVNRAIGAIDEADVVLLLIDVEENLTEQDKKIAALIVERGKGIILVLNKWDKLERVPNQFEAMKDRVRFLFPVLDFAPVIAISALKNSGIDELLKTALMVNRELDKRVDTGRFNRYLRKWVEEYSPPMVQHRRYKVRYGTQVGVRPVKFILFVNRISGFPKAYVQYILNKIRKVIGFHHIPIELKLRETDKGDASFLNS